MTVSLSRRIRRYWLRSCVRVRGPKLAETPTAFARRKQQEWAGLPHPMPTLAAPDDFMWLPPLITGFVLGCLLIAAILFTS